MNQISDEEYKELKASYAEKCEAEQELERVRTEIVAAFTSAGVYLLAKNPCAAGEITAAVQRLAHERLMLAQLAAGIHTRESLSDRVAMALRNRLLREAKAQA